MELVKTINNQDIDFWTWRGFVNATWVVTKASGGSAETVQAKKTIEVRILGEDGSKRTVTLPDTVKVTPHDDVSLVYARKVTDERGPLVGLVNHTINRTWAFPRGSGPVDYRHPFPLAAVKMLERITLFAAAFVLSGLTMLWLRYQAELDYSLSSWAVTGIVELGLLWLLKFAADRRQVNIDETVVDEVEQILKKVSYEPPREVPEPDAA
ncbi:hypothetical protein [Microvirga terricola]|uniref:Uncharacterized protein n=1 Tax=Microvirga terricola TaxID=2719797 RepID=A0ABX0V922_9HYPH|nr:hypothetical protein [Microvirga terricola]NIX76343.1 hypothetical protein [Microvirga terricola]